MEALNKSVRWHPRIRQWLNWTAIASSVVVSMMLLLTRFPGMELLGIGPNWPLIWVVAWSVKRTAAQGAIAGWVLGLIQDGLTSPDPLIQTVLTPPHPTRVIGLVLVGIFTSRFQKERYLQEDFISVALIVFGMVVMAETAIALQYSWMSDRLLADIWTDHQRFTLCSAIVSSLWAPVVYFPLNKWWEWVDNTKS